MLFESFTGSTMRNLSLGVFFFLLVTVNIVLWGPLSDSAVATPGVTLGFAVDGTGLISSAELSKELGAYLEEQLSIPVKVRNFTTEEHLYAWLTRFFEVDVAWLSEDFLQSVPEGQVLSLVRNFDHFPGIYRGRIVARPGAVSKELEEQLVNALLKMQLNEAGRALLTKMETSRFVASSRWQTSAWTAPATTEKPTSEAKGGLPVTTPVIASEIHPKDETADSNQDKAHQVTIEPTGVSSTEAVSAALPVEKTISDAGNKDIVETTAASEVIPSATKEAPVSPEVISAAEESKELAIPKGGAQEEPIALVADSLTYNSTEDSYEAKGDVVLKQAGVELTSETLLWQASTQDAAAEGDVHLKDAETDVSGEQLQYNMATGQGQVRDGRVFIHEGNFHLAGEQVEKRGQADYFVTKGSFTTCDGDIPDWKFTASEVDVTLGGYAKAKNVWFHIKDVPVLYTPYLLFPVKTERESGLLAPTFGYSNSKGVRTSLAWYQVIDRHLDATLYLDYLSEIGLGKGLEYRYALPGENNGEALYYHVTGLKDSPDLYYIDWQHSGKLPADWKLTADVEYANDQLFFDDFGEDAEQYNRDKTVSTILLQRNWQRLNLNGYGRYIKDLEDSNDTTLQRLPEIGLGLARYRLGETPVYASLESYATSFWRRDGVDGERLFLRPSLSAAFRPGSWLEIVPEVAVYERLYNVNDADDESAVPELSLTAATRLIKVYDFNRWGVDKVQHSIEPKVTYTYVPDENQENLPLFDVLDRIGKRNEVTYSLINRLTTRRTAEDGSKSYRDVFSLRLSQSYDVDEARKNESGKDQPLSDVRFEMDLSPNSNISLGVDGLVPVYGDTRFNRLSIGSSVKDDAGDAIKVNYTYRDLEYAGRATDYLRVYMATPILKPLYIQAEERYDFQRNRELEKAVGLEYRSKCWSILLSYRDRYRSNGERDHEFGVTFVLAGLGFAPGVGGGFGALDR